MSEWFVYRSDGPPIGPLPTKEIAEAILTGNLPPDVWVAAPNVPLTQARWLRASQVPVIAALLEGIPTRRRKESGMQMISPAPPGVEEDPDRTAIVTGPMQPYQHAPVSSHPITSSTPPKKLDATLKSSQKGGTALLPPIGSTKPVTEQEPVIELDSAVVGTNPEDPIPETERNSPVRGPDGFPLPAFPMPAPTPTPTPTPPSYYRGGETLESPGQERTPTKKRTSSA